MAEYLASGRTPDDRKVTERIEASSADEVVHILRNRGYTDIVLHTDDVSALYTQQSEVEKTFSPRAYVQLRQYRSSFIGHVFFLTRLFYVKSWPIHVLAVLLLTIRRVMGWPWDSLDYLALAILCLPIAVSAISHISSPARQYDRLIEAVSWHRWEEALNVLPSIRDRISPDEGAFREAQALAGLGHLDKALEAVRPFSDGSRLPEWLYWARLAEVYGVARQTPQEIASMEKAAELAPENPTVMLDLATVLLRHRRDTTRARALIENAKSHAISDLISPFVDRAEGILALARGDANEAVCLLEKALAGLRPFANGTPLIGLITDRLHAYLALAHAKLGDVEGAAQHYRKAEPRLLATKADDLLVPCREALRFG